MQSAKSKRGFLSFCNYIIPQMCHQVSQAVMKPTSWSEAPTAAPTQTPIITTVRWPTWTLSLSVTEDRRDRGEGGSTAGGGRLPLPRQQKRERKRSLIARILMRPARPGVGGIVQPITRTVVVAEVEAEAAVAAQVGVKLRVGIGGRGGEIARGMGTVTLNEGEGVGVIIVGVGRRSPSTLNRYLPKWEMPSFRYKNPQHPSTPDNHHRSRHHPVMRSQKISQPETSWVVSW